MTKLPPTPNPLQVAELHRLKIYYPYRIMWGMFTKEGLEWQAYADKDKRRLNKSLRAGHYCFSLVTSTTT